VPAWPLHTTDSRAAARTRWIVFRENLRFHLAAENAAMWPLARARLTGDTHGQALLDAMDDEQWLIGPLQTMTDDAFAMHGDSWRLRRLLARLQTRLASHLAHEEAEALPLIGQLMSQRELGAIASAIRGGHRVRYASRTVPWALAGASPDIRSQVLSQLPAPTRLLYRRVWLPRYSRNIPSP
jgi:hypothetical protein